MIISVRIDNYSVYSSEVELAMLADRRIRRFGGNVQTSAGFKLLKSACVYGANNAGKSCALRAIAALKNLFDGKRARLNKNVFTDNPYVCLGMSFICDNKAYSFDCTYKTQESGGGFFTYERLARIYSGKKEDDVIYVYDENDGLSFAEKGNAVSGEFEITPSDVLAPFSHAAAQKKLKKAAKILQAFSDKIEILDMNSVTLEKTLDVLKKGQKEACLVREFVKNADLDIDDVFYDADDKCEKVEQYSTNEPLARGADLKDLLRLTTVRRGIKIKSLLYDSSGTKRVIAASSYICEALLCGKVLVADELDSGLHFKLTRAVISLFNNELNEKAQIIFSLHDATLLDCQTLFRKDQVWFAYKNADGEYLYSLNDLEETCGLSYKKIADEYRKGSFMKLPSPDLFALFDRNKEDEDD